ncbi:MAG: 1-deoxy-D-xylulose-5-phosphate reductoisomerase [Candidatus Izemoplasmatales bacterium]
MKNLYILGATGSIGRQTLEIVDAYPNEFKVITLSARTRISDLIDLIFKYEPKFVSVESKEDADRLSDMFENIVIGYGKESLIHAATFQPKDDNALLVNALVGMSGLVPTLEAIKIKRDIALANKETLVVGGDLVKKLAHDNQVHIYPIDSEHSALWQCFNGEKKESIHKVIITASGGSFRGKKVEELEHVTKEEALKHPNWTMGNKITIDSATLMNKGFEIIEAMHLFDLGLDQIEAILHPESIVHSMVEYVDHSIIAQLSSHDMKLPIEYALFYPERKEAVVEALDLTKVATLHFESIPIENYPCFTLAMIAAKKGGSMPCVLNAANEVAVDLFLHDQIGFNDIARTVEKEMNHHEWIENPSLEQLIQIDQEIRNRY